MQRFSTVPFAVALLTLSGCFYTTNVTPDMIDNAAARETRRLQQPLPQQADPGPAWFIEYVPARLENNTCGDVPRSVTMQHYQITNRYIGEYAVFQGPEDADESNMRMMAGGPTPKPECKIGVGFVYSKTKGDVSATLGTIITCADGESCQWITSGTWHVATSL
jgi:hypothetical protein